MNQKVMILLHEYLIPPDRLTKAERLKSNTATEYDVLTNLKNLNYEVLPLGVSNDASIITRAIDNFKPTIVFNLMEEFHHKASFDQNVVSFLEMNKIPYTGCNPQGLMLARNKDLAKKILKFHGIATPAFHVYPLGSVLKMPDLKFPLIVKCLNEDGSLGLSKASIVNNEKKLFERIKFIHKKFEVDAIAEEFISGREFFVGLLGNQKLHVLPPWEFLINGKNPPKDEFYTDKAKFDLGYRKKKGIVTKKAELSELKLEEIKKICKETFGVLQLNGYARIDLRMDERGKLWVIEANPNPDIAFDDEFAQSAKHLGMDYPLLLEKIIGLGLKWHKLQSAA
ncbi:MAG: D-alanine--D-alanine ligase [Epsilonproteobacteria bacterium]|nr:MAG: D-alanine--D-alanine ligase [Campylobacterota bacterium]RLA66213.1 MAG: D-alanine--D-alanine ligase [Campylobacterota bacterium]